MSEADVTWSVKEVFSELKGDIMKRFDSQDKRLEDIGKRLDGTATTEDVREIHQRIDDLEIDVKGLKDERDADAAVASAASRFRRRVWLVVTAVCVPLIAALILAFVHP